MAEVVDQVDLRKLQRLLGEDSWRLTPATMAHKLSFGEWLPSPHLLYIAAKVATAIARGRGRLVVSMPPRHGKSELLSTWTPIWALDRDPTTEIILTTYGADLSQDFSRKTRDIMLECQRGENVATLNATLRQDSLQVGRFHTTKRGGVRAVGISGAVTGRGADLLLVDDFLKNAKEAASEALRRDIFEWFTTVAMTRLSPTGTAIILATRWNIGDLIGMLKDHDKNEAWEFIELPAFALENDPLGRDVGEVLWPTRFNAAHIQEVSDLMGEYYFQALYQQKPVPSSGGAVTRSDFHIIDILPNHSNLQFYRSWDMGATADGGDYTVGTLFALDKATKYNYIVDVIRKQMGPFEVKQCIAKTALNDPPGTKILLEQEPGSAGKTVVDDYMRNVLSGYVAEGIRPTGDKFVRAQPLYAAIQAGLLKLLRGKWNEDYISEFLIFPDCLNDDQVDTTSQAYNKAHGKKYGGVAWGKALDKIQQEKSQIIMPKKSGIITGVTFGRN